MRNSKVNKKKRILIIGDSLAMPRPGVSYEDTWVYKLIKAFPEFDLIDKTRRASTSERLVTEGGGNNNPYGADLLEHYMPDVVIMHLGIVDCAPRYIKKGSLENIILNRIMPKNVQTRYVEYVKKNRVRDPRKAYVLPDRFRSNLTNYFQRAETHNAKIIAIMILPVTNVFVNKSPYINQSIEDYNDIYRDLSKDFKNVDVVRSFDNSINLEDITIDGYHVNLKGHDIIFQKLIYQISAILIMKK